MGSTADRLSLSGCRCCSVSRISITELASRSSESVRPAVRRTLLSARYAPPSSGCNKRSSARTFFTLLRDSWMASSRFAPRACPSWLTTESSSSRAILRTASATDSSRLNRYAISLLHRLPPLRVRLLHQIDIRIPRIAGDLFAYPARSGNVPFRSFHFSDHKALVLGAKFIDLPGQIIMVDLVTRLFDDRLHAHPLEDLRSILNRN